MFGATVAAVLVLASSTSNDDDDYNFDNDYTGGDDGSIEDTGTAKQHPALPTKAFLWLYDHWGEDAAQEVLDKVQIGEISVDEVDTYINRPDINPKDWADYEDGWRPSEW